MSLEAELREALENQSRAMDKALSYEKKLQSLADSILRRTISFERAVYQLEKESGYDRWFVGNDLRQVIGEIIPLRKGQ